jgi:hypothetical protein
MKRPDRPKDEKRARLIEAARSARTIIEYDKCRGDQDIRPLVDDNRRFGNPIDYLCLSVDGSSSCSPFPDFDTVLNWVESYRRFETLPTEDQTIAERPRLPICILIATDPPPTTRKEWHEDGVLREKVANLGALLLDRPKSPATPVSDDDLFLEIIAAAMPDPDPVQTMPPAIKFDFDWTPSIPVGPLGAEYGRQPSSVDGLDKDFPKKFDLYSEDSPDLEF